MYPVSTAHPGASCKSWWKAGGVGKNSIGTNLTKIAQACEGEGRMLAYSTLTYGSFRHCAQPLCVRCNIPDAIRSIIIGHLTGDLAYSKKLTDSNLAAYSRDLMTTLEDVSKVGLIFAAMGKRFWHEVVSPELLLNVEENMPEFIIPVGVDSRRMALERLNHVASIDDAPVDAPADGFSNSTNKFSFDQVDFDVDGSVEPFQLQVRCSLHPAEITSLLGSRHLVIIIVIVGHGVKCDAPFILLISPHY
jgi:hypothetical protein